MLVIMRASQSGTAAFLGSLLLGAATGCVGMPLGDEAAAPRLTPPVTLAEVTRSWNLTADRQNLYWTYNDTNRPADLVAMPQIGGPPSTVAPGTAFREIMASGDGWIYGIDSGDLLSRVPAAGGAPETFARAGEFCNVGAVSAGAVWCGFGLGLTRVDLETRAAARVGASAGYIAESLAVDRSQAYWVAGGSLLAVDHGGGATRVLLGYGGNGDTPWPHLVAVDERAVFAATGPGIVRIDKATGRMTTLKAGLVTAIAVGHGLVFWSEADTGRVGATPATGGRQVVIGEGQSVVQEMVATDTGLFWFSLRPGDLDHSALRGAYFTPAP